VGSAQGTPSAPPNPPPSTYCEQYPEECGQEPSDSEDPTIWLPGFDKATLEPFLQDQGSDGNACASYSIAMALNILLGSDFTGEEIEALMEGHGYKASLLFGLFSIGTLPAGQAAFLDDILANYPGDYGATLSQGDNTADLIQNLLEGKITVISVSWGSGIEGVFNGVGHALVLAGYNPRSDMFYFLDPGGALLREYSDERLTEIWLGQPNFAIPAGSMVTISQRR